MEPNEIKIIQELTGVDPTKITLSDNGFWSRGYIIDDGRIVFKFKKTPDFSYQGEIDAINFVNTLDLGVNLQKVRWTSPDDLYLGMDGVVGEPLTVVNKNHNDLNQMYNLDGIAAQLAHAIRKLHQAKPNQAVHVTLDEEIDAWQQRICDPTNWQALTTLLSPDEAAIIDDFVRHTAPTKLRELGENPVLTHGDLYKNNVFIDKTGKVGIIDFYQLQLMDEAADFMDISNDLLRDKILQQYNANDILRAKVQIRAMMRPIYIFGAYVGREDADTQLPAFVRRMRRLIGMNYHLV